MLRPGELEAVAAWLRQNRPTVIPIRRGLDVPGWATDESNEHQPADRETVLAMHQMYARGSSLEQVGDAYGRQASGVRALFMRHGLAVRARKGWRKAA